MAGLSTGILQSALRVQDRQDDDALGEDVKQRIRAAAEALPRPSFTLPDLSTYLTGLSGGTPQPVAAGQPPAPQQPSSGFRLPDLSTYLGDLATPPPTPSGTPSAMPTAPEQPNVTIEDGRQQPQPRLQPGETVGDVRISQGQAPAGGDYGSIDNSSRESFVRTAWPYMLEAAEGDANLAELMLAKAINENGSIGTGRPIWANNFSGLKGEGDAGSVEADTWEEVGGQRVSTRARFAAYSTPQAGMAAFMARLRTNPVYADALARYQQSGDASQLFRDINTAGYATDSNWAATIENIRAGQVAPVVRGLPSPSARQAPQAERPDQSWLAGAPVPVQTFATPNVGARRQATRGIVVHATRGQGRTPDEEYQATIRHFANPQSEVSAHAVIAADGTIAAVGDWDAQTWHAGENNADRIGIEIVQSAADAARGVPFTDAQYRSLAWLTGQLARRYGFGIDRNALVGHSELEQGQRHGKTDPGDHFDWQRYQQEAQAAATGQPVATMQRAPLNAGAAQSPAPAAPSQEPVPATPPAGAGSDPLSAARDASWQQPAYGDRMAYRQPLEEGGSSANPYVEDASEYGQWSAPPRPPASYDPSEGGLRAPARPRAADDPGGAVFAAQDSQSVPPAYDSRLVDEAPGARELPQQPPVYAPNQIERYAPSYAPQAAQVTAAQAPAQGIWENVVKPVLDTLDAANEWVIANPVVGQFNPQAWGRELAGTSQLHAEVKDDMARLQELLRRYRAGDTSVEAEMLALNASINARVAPSDKSNRQVLLEAGERNPDKTAETLGQAVQAGATLALAPSLASGPVRNVVAGALDPLGQAIGAVPDVAVAAARTAGRGVRALGNALPQPEPGVRMLGSGLVPEGGQGSQYLYHTTDRWNLEDIATGGLRPQRPSYRQEQDFWPRAMGGTGREGRVYFAADPDTARSFQEPGGALLRVRRDVAEKMGLLEEFQGRDFFVRKRIRPQDIEVLVDGEWRPLKEAASDPGIVTDSRQWLPSGLVPSRATAANAAQGALIGAASEDFQAQQEGRETDPWSRLGRGLAGAALGVGAGRAAARGRMQPPGVRQLGSGLVVSPDEAAMRGLTRPGVIPPHVSDQLDIPVRIPDDPRFGRAVAAIGGEIDPERGVTLPWARAQGADAAGRPAARGGVFAEAIPPTQESAYARPIDNPNNVGGTQVLRGQTRFRAPLVVEGEPGGSGFNQAMQRLSNLDEDAINAARADVQRWGQRASEIDNEMADAARRGLPTDDLQRQYDAANEAGAQALERLRGLQAATPTATEIDFAIQAARRAGPEGSPARAEALKEVVRRFGGDPDLIDPLLAVRGADAAESAWAIKENILAAHARRAGYDGVFSVQKAGGASASEIGSHPKVVAALKAYEDSIAAYEAAKARHLGDLARGSDETFDTYWNRVSSQGGRAFDSRNARAAVDPAVIAAENAMLQADQALTVAKIEAFEELTERVRISEYMDVRAATNPTPGDDVPSVTNVYQRLRRAESDLQNVEIAVRDARAAGDEATAASLESALSAARSSVDDLYEIYDHILRTGDLKTPPTPPAVRADVPRKPGANFAGLPIDPSGAAIGAGAGAATGEEGEEPDPWRTATGLLIGGILGRKGMNAAEREAWQRAIKAAAARGGKASEELAEKARRYAQGEIDLGAIDPLTDASRRTDLPAPSRAITDEPNRPRVLGDVPPSAIRKPTLPGMGPLDDVPPPRPIAEVASEMRRPDVPNVADRALESFPAARNWIDRARLRNEARMRRRGIETASPLRWLADLAGNVQYSAMLGPATFSVNAFVGLGDVLWNVPKEFTRGVVRAVQTGSRAALREQGQMHAGALYGLTQVGEAVLDALKGTGRYASPPDAPRLSERTANPIARAVAAATEFPGRAWTGVPDAIYGTIALHAGQAREAAQMATDAGLRGDAWKKRVSELLDGSRAVLRGELPTSPDVQRVVDAGERYAKRAAYRDDLGKVGQAARKLARLGDLPALGPWASPFFTSIWNGGLRMMEKSPAGAAMATQPARFDKVYDTLVGTAVLFALGNYAQGGGVTGSGPADPKERELLQEKGWQRYSTLTTGPDGKQYYVPNRMYQTFETPLNIAGEIHDYFAYGKPDQTTSQRLDEAVRRMGQIVRQNPYALSGIVSIAEAGQFGLPSFVAEQATRLTPFAATARGVGTSVDPSERTVDRGKDVDPADEIVQRWQQSVGLRSGLPEAQDAFGQPKPNEQPGVWAFAPRMRQQREAPVADLFREARMAPGDPKPEIRVGENPSLPPVPLAPSERRLWDRKRGEVLLDAGREIANDPSWKDAPLEVRQKVLRRVMDLASKAADGQVLESIGDDEITRRIDAAIARKAS